ncbi:hypothetical protein E4656_08295 [Natronospirillum operosum]|uniref:Uncharacterized protein n=1 Tax=Natronospirillum operosum TaxID=2759953 RepID=A0A4Z0WAE4_9GAMM|nr:hypothetical protein [Natronospirillum operosum]TGG94159.1 hypothetical protein E4656_08295 [Natronospirillum operosum]
MRDWRKELAWALGAALLMLGLQYYQSGHLQLTGTTWLLVLFPLVLALGISLYRYYRIRKLGGIPEVRTEHRAVVDIRLDAEQAMPAIEAVAKRFATYSFHRNYIDLNLTDHEWLELQHAGDTLYLMPEQRGRSVVVHLRSPCQLTLLRCQRALEACGRAC